MNRKVLRAPTLAGPTRNYQGSRPPSCTTPRQPTSYEGSIGPYDECKHFFLVLALLRDCFLCWDHLKWFILRVTAISNIRDYVFNKLFLRVPRRDLNLGPKACHISVERYYTAPSTARPPRPVHRAFVCIKFYAPQNFLEISFLSIGSVYVHLPLKIRE